MQTATSFALSQSAMPHFGALGVPMGERKFKKKPILVLADGELAEAHRQFQLGAAEQIGQFDPHNRPQYAAPSTPPVLQLVEDEDDYHSPYTLEHDDPAAAEALDAELPPIDLDALLAAADDFADLPSVEFAYEEPEADAEPDAVEQASAMQPAAMQPAAVQAAPSNALDSIINRLAVAQQQSEPDIVFAPELPPETQAELAPEQEWAAEPKSENVKEPPDILELVDLADDECEMAAAPFCSPVPVYETDPASTQTGVILREELTLARPALSIWRRTTVTLRRFRWGRLG